MKVAVLGTGMVGQGHAQRLRTLGHDVVVGARTGDGSTVPYAEAVAGADLVINAVNGAVAAEVFGGLADALAGTVVLDLSNPLDFSSGRLELFVCNTDSLGERIQRAAPAARVVKTLCTVNISVQVEPALLGDEAHVMFVAGEDESAKQVATALLREYGWREILDLGGIDASRALEMMLPMWVAVYQRLGTGEFNYRIVTSSPATG